MSHAHNILVSHPSENAVVDSSAPELTAKLFNRIVEDKIDKLIPALENAAHYRDEQRMSQPKLEFTSAYTL
jgi:hypothetical protein